MLESRYSPRDIALAANPNTAAWADAPSVSMDLDFLGARIPGPPTEVRSRWTNGNLYLLYICPYNELNLKPDPNVTAKTPKLWDWDVAEAFIGSDFQHINLYKEFEVSPQGEWVDLDIDSDHQDTQTALKWNSGIAVAARIDAEHKVWYGEMRIPFASIIPRPPEKGMELRIGLYRCSGIGGNRTYYAWSPTGKRSFHVPAAFGTLRLR